MQDRAKVKLNQIIDILNNYFNISAYVGKDSSFTKRIGQYYDVDIISIFEHGFIENCNGLMIRGKGCENVESIFGAPFLSNDVLISLLTNNCANGLLIVHHPLDINGGINKKEPFIGYNSVSRNNLFSFFNRNNSIYSIHLPLDLNIYEINTHLSLLKSLSIDARITDELIEDGQYKLGYILETTFIDINQLFLHVRRISDACFIENEEFKKPPNRIGLLAGMFNSPTQIKQVEKKECDICICGDLYIRDGSRRFLEMKQAVRNSLIPFICLSHNISEGQIFRHGLFPYLKTIFPTLDYKEIECYTFK